VSNFFFCKALQSEKMDMRYFVLLTNIFAKINFSARTVLMSTQMGRHHEIQILLGSNSGVMTNKGIVERMKWWQGGRDTIGLVARNDVILIRVPSAIGQEDAMHRK
jgi:hypothetical protein